jgi:hypothetical protein
MWQLQRPGDLADDKAAPEDAPEAAPEDVPCSTGVNASCIVPVPHKQSSVYWLRCNETDGEM